MREIDEVGVWLSGLKGEMGEKEWLALRKGIRRVVEVGRREGFGW